MNGEFFILPYTYLAEIFHHTAKVHAHERFLPIVRNILFCIVRDERVNGVKNISPSASLSLPCCRRAFIPLSRTHQRLRTVFVRYLGVFTELVGSRALAFQSLKSCFSYFEGRFSILIDFNFILSPLVFPLSLRDICLFVWFVTKATFQHRYLATFIANFIPFGSKHTSQSSFDVRSEPSASFVIRRVLKVSSFSFELSNVLFI